MVSAFFLRQDHIILIINGCDWKINSINLQIDTCLVKLKSGVVEIWTLITLIHPSFLALLHPPIPFTMNCQLWLVPDRWLVFWFISCFLLLLFCCCRFLIQIFLYCKTLMNAKEIIMIAARMEFVQIHRDHTTATVPEGIAVMVGIVQVMIRSSHYMSSFTNSD